MPRGRKKKELVATPVFEDEIWKKSVRQIIADLYRLSNAAVGLEEANEYDDRDKQVTKRSEMQMWGHRVYLRCQQLKVYAPETDDGIFADREMAFNSSGSAFIEKLHKDFVRDIVQ